MSRFHIFRILTSIICFTLLLFLGSKEIHAQSYSLSQQYQNQRQNTSIFKISTSTNDSSRKNSLAKEYVQQHSILNIDETVVTSIQKHKEELLNWDLEIDGKKTTLLLFPFDCTTNDYISLDANHQIQNMDSKLLHYRGYVEGYPNSLVSLNVFESELRLIYSAKGFNTVINKLGGDYIVYREQNLRQKQSSTCKTDNSMASIRSPREVISEKSIRNAASSCVEIYMEADHQSYLDHNSNLSVTHDWMVSLFNDVATVYANDGMTISLSSSKIWDIPDPYTSKNTPGSMLSSFADEIQNDYQGRLAHLVTTRPIDGGVAWVDVLCSDYSASSSSGPYAFSGNLSSSHTPFPTYSWNVNVFAHELGHNIGSPHTHDCVWNGNNTQIDDCGNVAGFGGGACYDANNPIIPGQNQGSIMSYCYLSAGNGVSLSDGFGPQPVALMHNRINNATCNVGCMGYTCGDGIQNGDEDGIDCGGSLCPDCPPAFNDNCALALDINQQLNLFSGSQTLLFPSANNTATGSGKSPAVPNYAGCNTFRSWCNYSIQKDVWYSFTAPLSMAPPHGAPLAFLKISTLGSDFDTQIALYKDCSSNAITANDDFHGPSGSYQSLVTAAIKPGQTYYLQIDGYNSSSFGDLQLNFEYFPLYGTCNSNGTTIDADWEAVDEDGWTHYIDEEEKVILLSAKKNGENIGWVGIDNSTSCEVMASSATSNLGTEGCAAPYASVPYWWVSHRTWSLHPMTQPHNPIEIRSYYKSAEFNSLADNNPFGLDHLQAVHFKVIGNEDLSVNGNECHQEIEIDEFATYQGTQGEFTYGNYGTDHYAQYMVPDLLGGGGFGFINTQTQALPLELLSFTAEQEGLSNKLSWSTTSEINSQYQIIEKSYDGLGFWHEVGRVQSQNDPNSINDYSLIDEKPWGKTYYRLRSVDFDQSEQLSDIIFIERQDASFVSNVYPNPTFETFNLEINSTLEEIMTWEIYSLKGELMLEDEVRNERGRNTITVDVSSFPAGIYQILVKRGDTAEVMRITKS